MRHPLEPCHTNRSIFLKLGLPGLVLPTIRTRIGLWSMIATDYLGLKGVSLSFLGPVRCPAFPETASEESTGLAWRLLAYGPHAGEQRENALFANRTGKGQGKQVTPAPLLGVGDDPGLLGFRQSGLFTGPPRRLPGGPQSGPAVPASRAWAPVHTRPSAACRTLSRLFCRPSATFSRKSSS